MVNSEYRQYLLSIYSVMMTIECIVSLELKELCVPAQVLLDTNAQLSCIWELSPIDILYSVKWYKDGKEFFRHVPRDSEPMRKFPLPGVNVQNSNSSGSSIVLSPVTFETAGRYRCEVSGERPHFPTVSNYADMFVVDPPHHGPVISGFHRKYQLGDRMQVNCTSGRSRPACQLQWYINGEPIPATTVLQIHQVHADKRESTILLLDFTLTEQHFRKKAVKIKCLSTISTLYWQSNEETALLEKEINRERISPNKQKLNYGADVSTNLGSSFTSPSWNTVCTLVMFVRLCVYDIL